MTVAPAAAVAIVAAAIASYVVASVVVPPPLGFLVAQLALVAIACAGVGLARPARRRAALGLRAARPRFFAAAIAIGATAWYVNAWLVSWLVRHLAISDAQIDHLKDLVDQPPLAYGLAMFALVPAVCEEIVFRGVLARALGRRGSLLGAAAVSAIVFAAYHLSLVQAVPTLTLGALLAVIAIRADSIAPTVVAHAINNALAIALSRGELPAVAAWLGDHPVIALAGCSAALVAGMLLATRSRA